MFDLVNAIVALLSIIYFDDRFDLEQGAIQALAGIHDYTVHNPNMQRIDFEHISHEQYDPSVLPYDIAILKTATPINFNEAVSAACLPNAEPHIGDECVTSGWGDTLSKYVHSMCLYMPA